MTRVGQVSKFVATDLKFGHIPTVMITQVGLALSLPMQNVQGILPGIVVGGSSNEAILSFVRSFRTDDVDGELDFQELHRLVPLHFAVNHHH